MHRPSKVFAAAAAVASLTACPCAQGTRSKTIPVAQMPSATLLALYEPDEPARVFSGNVQVDDGVPCDELAPSATGDVSGVELWNERQPVDTCGCTGSRFSVNASTIPDAADATFRVADDSGEMTATVPGLFLARFVAVRGSPAQLVPGTRAYLDVVPEGETMDQVAVSFQSYSAGSYGTRFTFDSTDGTLGHDAGGWYFDVPSVGPEMWGQVALYAQAHVAASSCAGAGRCEIIARVRGWLTTTVTAAP